MDADCGGLALLLDRLEGLSPEALEEPIHSLENGDILWFAGGARHREPFLCNALAGAPPLGRVLALDGGVSAYLISLAPALPGGSS